ncbi:MAG: ABC transporter substrate-binding protein [Saprospiraceae bacterium]|nr:ABC transporter substrate-binding protein [Saprospiraceae bacterium]
MKYSNLSFIASAVFFALSLMLIVFFASCNPSRNITTDNNQNTHLDPVVAKNTNPEDTLKPENYIGVTNAIGVNNSSNSDTIIWCDTVQESEFRFIVVCFEKVGNNQIKADTIQVIDLNDASTLSITKIDSTINLKLAYKVAIIMPFMSNGFVPAPTKEIPPKSIKAVEFYEGVLIALDSLKAEGVSLFVDVFDSERDTGVVRSLLQKQELKEADLIIGPLGSNAIKIVAEYAKEHKKPMISPFNSRADLTTNNPYYIQVNPSFQVHSDLIIAHLHKIERDKKVIREPLEKNLLILGLKEDSLRIRMLQKSYSVYKNDTIAQIPELIMPTTTIDIDTLKPFLNEEELNIIVVPSYRNEGFIYNSMREIQKLVDKVEPKNGYQIVVIGMDKWRYYTRVNFEYFESLNLHFSSSYYTNKETSGVRKFNNDYKAVYGIGSREFSFVGFDLMLFFGRMMHKYGVNFPAHLSKESAQYRHTIFQVQPTYDTIMPPIQLKDNHFGQTILRSYENKYLNFLKFERYKLNKVN